MLLCVWWDEKKMQKGGARIEVLYCRTIKPDTPASLENRKSGRNTEICPQEKSLLRTEVSDLLTDTKVKSPAVSEN